MNKREMMSAAKAGIWAWVLRERLEVRWLEKGTHRRSLVFQDKTVRAALKDYARQLAPYPDLALVAGQLALNILRECA